jgi:hypothetical protein
MFLLFVLSLYAFIPAADCCTRYSNNGYLRLIMQVLLDRETEAHRFSTTFLFVLQLMKYAILIYVGFVIICTSTRIGINLDFVGKFILSTCENNFGIEYRNIGAYVMIYLAHFTIMLGLPFSFFYCRTLIGGIVMANTVVIIGMCFWSCAKGALW